MISQSMLKNALTLGAFALVTTAMIVMAHALSSPRIEDSKQRELQQSLTALVAADRYDNDLLHDTITINDRALLHLDNAETAYRARKYGQPVAVIFPVIAPDGYSGKIRLLVGIDNHGRILGVKVLAHRETPGLGDAIEAEKSDWINSFTGKTLDQPSTSGWLVQKDGGDFDQFTGATITPRAVVRAVHNALLYYQNRQTALFAPAISRE